MSGLSKSFLAAALFPCLLLPAAGQIRSNASLVLVPVTVTDRNGATVNGLDRTKFTVFEDNVPRPIVAFNSEDAPSSVGLIFDISGSMRDRLNLAKTALRAFVEDSNPEDEAFLLTVSSRPEAYSDFTSDLEALASAAQFTRAGGSTALVDTIFVGLDRIRSASHTRRALLILSDGMDNHSRHSRSELMRRAVEADVQIYTIVIDSRVRTKKPIELEEENRGIAFMVSDGGYVDNVVLSNLVIGTKRYDWFWWGDGDPIFFMIERRSESRGQPDKPGEPAAGSIRNVMIRNVIAHGQGSCVITGHPTSWLDNVSFENIRLFTSHDPASMYDKAVNALQFRYAKNLRLKDVEVNWQKPDWVNWRSALYFEDVSGLKLQGFTGGPAKLQSEVPAVILDKVDDATILNSRPRPGTRLFLKVTGANSQKIYVVGNDFHDVRTPYQVDSSVKPGAVTAINSY